MVSKIEIPIVVRGLDLLFHIAFRRLTRIGQCEGIHAGMCHEFWGHAASQFAINDGNVRCNPKVRNRLLDSAFIIRDDGKAVDFHVRARCG